jgi:outer membrane protein OmpA-like peptidoglycan-associated protein/tetratricopeptide (TPR) repeat protein
MKWTLTIFIIWHIVMHGISSHVCKKGDLAYSQLQYTKAIEEYTACLSSDKKFNGLTLTKLANSYRILDNFPLAEYWYKRAMSLKESDPKCAYWYVAMVHANGNKNLSHRILDSLLIKKPRDKDLLNLKSTISLASSLDSFIITKADFNSVEADFSPTKYGTKMVFSSSRPSSSKGDLFTGQSFSTLWQVDSITNGEASAFTTFSKFKYNIGAAVFSPDGNEIYFTANNNKTNKKGIANLTILTSRFINDQWSLPNALDFASGPYNYAHPALSKDGNFLVFASDKIGGNYNLYYTTIGINGKWNLPKPFKKNINTAQQEGFPTFLDNNKLIFSSDGLSGSAGLDMYETTFKNGNWTDPIRLPIPFNSQKDDYGMLSLDTAMTHGYLTSNRFDVNGNEDILVFSKTKPCTIIAHLLDVTQNISIPNQIYNFNLSKDLLNIRSQSNGKAFHTFFPDGIIRVRTSYEGIVFDSTVIVPASCRGDTILIKFVYRTEKIELTGTITEYGTNSEIPYAKIIFRDKETEEETIVNADDKGVFKVNNLDSKEYEITIKKEGYFGEQVNISISKNNNLKPINLNLKKLEVNRIFVLKNILYDFDDWKITLQSEIDLDRIIDVLQENPNIKIELSSHTDSRGNDDYNIELSDKRGKSAVAYIISKGIEFSRLIAKGYGETQHINHCKNGVKCDEDLHHNNRRTEIKILEN